METYILDLISDCTRCKEEVEKLDRIMTSLKTDLVDGESLRIVLSMHCVEGVLHLENVSCSRVIFR